MQLATSLRSCTPSFEMMVCFPDTLKARKLSSQSCRKTTVESGFTYLLCRETTLHHLHNKQLTSLVQSKTLVNGSAVRHQVPVSYLEESMRKYIWELAGRFLLLKTARSLWGSLYGTYVTEKRLNRSRCTLVLGYWFCLAQEFARRKCWEVFKSKTIIYEAIDCSWQLPHIASWQSTQGSWESIICNISAPLPWNIGQGEKPSHGL